MAMPEERSNTRPTLCFRIFSFSKHEPQFLPTRHFTLSEMFWSQVSGPFVVATCVLRFFCRYVTPSKQVVHMLPKNAMWCHSRVQLQNAPPHLVTQLLSFTSQFQGTRCHQSAAHAKWQHLRHSKSQIKNLCEVPQLNGET